MKKIITLVVTLVIIAGLAVVLYVGGGDEPDEVVDTSIVPIVARTDRELTRVAFVSDTQDYALLPLFDDWGFLSWQFEPDPSFVLNTMLAHSLIRPAWSLTAFDTAHETSDGLNLAEFGLDQPQLIIRAEYDDGAEKNIYIGAQTADMRFHFVQTSASNAIYIVPRQDLHAPLGGIKPVIDRTIQSFTFEAERIIFAERDREPIELSMASVPTDLDDAIAAVMPITPEGRILRLLQPMDTSIDHTRLSLNVLEPMENFRLGDVVSLAPDDLSPYGLAVPSLMFSYQDPTGETVLLFGDTFEEEINDQIVTFIYVKFADRPHVFRALHEPVSHLYGLNIFLFIERFITLISILEVDAINITAQDHARNFDMQINHAPGDQISPTINGTSVDASAFRLAYRLLVGLSMEGEIEPFTPTIEPDFTITYHLTDGSTREMRFFAEDNALYSVSVDGADAWFITHSRDLNVFFSRVDGMLE